MKDKKELCWKCVKNEATNIKPHNLSDGNSLMIGFCQECIDKSIEAEKIENDLMKKLNSKVLSKMGKLTIKYEHSNKEWHNTEEWEMDNTKAYELFQWFSDIVWKITRWK